MDKFRIDSHKLMFHVPRVAAWLAGETVYPIYAEISPTGACNHRCTFCALDYMAYQPRALDADLMATRLAEMGRLGLKSVMFAGEGEPFLHPQLGRMISAAKGAGIDVSLTSNGVLLTEERAREMLPQLSWIKVSINAGTAATYAAIHRTKEADFDKVIANFRRAVELRRQHGWECAIGFQLLLLPENRAEVATLAALGREIGIDYLVVKPYSQHLHSQTEQYLDTDYSDAAELQREVAAYATDSYQVLVRTNTMEKLSADRPAYPRCRALPFWSYIDAGGGVWGCSAHLGDERFLYGNITTERFEEIWTGETRRASLRWVEEELDTTACRVNCRMDEINRYLNELRHPGAHVNFI